MSEKELTIEQTIEEVMRKENNSLSEEQKKEMKEALKQHFTEGIPPLNALGFSPEFVNVLYDVGIQLYEKEEFDRASEIFSTMALLDPSNYRAYFGQAICEHKMQRYGIAMVHYFSSLYHEPKDPLPYYHLADCFMKLEKPLMAEEALLKVIEYAEENEKKKENGFLAERAKLWLNKIKQEQEETAPEQQ